MSERLYYTDCYLSSFEAQVLEAGQGGVRVYLDRTAFYPSSGGQPNDLGTLGGQAVVDVIDEGERIAHLVEAPVEARSIHGQIDWRRRYDHMQQHTGQHLLSAVLVELFGYQTLSFHMGGEVSTIELATNELSAKQMEETEERANEIVREARPVSILFEDAENAQALRKPSARTGTLRVIEIAHLDRSACGGTHVRSTAELGPIQIRKTEKIRGHVRIEFVCGRRALLRAKQDYALVAELARESAVPIDRVAEHVAGLRQRLRDSEKERQNIVLELARREGEALYDATKQSPDGLRRTLLRTTAIDEGVRTKVQAFTARGRALALAIGEQAAGVLIAASADAGINAGAILKQVLAGAGGRGGGSGTLAQGNMTSPAVEAALKAALGFDAAS